MTWVTGSGVIRGITAGQATITGLSQADPARTASLTVTVTSSGSITNLDAPAAYLVQVVQQFREEFLEARERLIALLED